MAVHDLAAVIQERIDRFCMNISDGLGIAVTTPDMELWDTIPWPDTLFRYGWMDPARTDGHPSGWVFPYQPEVMAATVTGLDPTEVDRYVDALLLYVTLYIGAYRFEKDPAERRRKVEDLMYDTHPEELALMSYVQTGQGAT